MRNQLEATVVTPWGTRVKYLGGWLMDKMDSSMLLDMNYVLVLTLVWQQLAQWAKLKRSRFGRVAVLKIKVLPRFIFLFRNLILPLSAKMLTDVQCLFNDFIWGH